MPLQAPPVIAKEITVRMPEGFTPPAKTIELLIEPPKVEFKTDALEISGKVTFPASAVNSPGKKP